MPNSIYFHLKMILANDKSKMTIDRLAFENELCREHIKLNTDELLKRKEAIKQLTKLYDFELMLRKPRKIFGFLVEKEGGLDLDYDCEIQNFFKTEFQQNQQNKIKIYNKIYDFVYIKLKYNQIYETKEINLPHAKITQIDPNTILKKQENLINK